MNSHILSGAVGAILALAGSTALDNLKCNRIEANGIALTLGGQGVSIGPSGIELRDDETGAWCLLNANGMTIMGSESSEGGAARLLVSPEAGASLHLIQNEAIVSLKAFGGAAPEASLRARFKKNDGAVLVYPDTAFLCAGAGDKASVLDCTGTRVLPESRVDGQPAQTVFVTRTGDKYHRAGCQYL